MVTVGFCVTMLLCAAETEAPEDSGIEVAAGEEPGEAVASDAESEESEAAGEAIEPEVDPDSQEATEGSRSGPGLEERIKKSRRRRAGDVILGPASDGGSYGDPGVVPGETTFVGEERPAVLRPRSEVGALALGGLVGFGSGYYYAGVPRWGLVFTLVDAFLVGGFVTSTVVLNNLVIEHDFNQGKSLARDERDFTKLEEGWYSASIVFALAAVGSRVFQAFGGMRAARRTNETLESFSFVPLGDGAAFELRLSW